MIFVAFSYDLKAQQILHRGELLSEELSVKILQERLKSPEVSHYGMLFFFRLREILPVICS